MLVRHSYVTPLAFIFPFCLPLDKGTNGGAAEYVGMGDGALASTEFSEGAWHQEWWLEESRWHPACTQEVPS